MLALAGTGPEAMVPEPVPETEATGETELAVAPPTLLTVSTAVNVAPCPAEAGTLQLPDSAAADCTVTLAPPVAEVTAPEFTSVPAAEKPSVRDPDAVPFSVSAKANDALAPPAMSTAAGAAPTDAAAPVDPVAPSEGVTACAVAPPVLRTSAVAVKAWPRSMVDGAVSEITDRCAGSRTCTADDELALTGWPLFWSVPLALASSRSAPAEVPFSVSCQEKVAFAPGSRLTGGFDPETVAAAPPERTVAPSAGVTLTAVVPPPLCTTSTALNVWPRLSACGTVNDDTVKDEGGFTATTAEPDATRATPLLASEPDAVTAMLAVPVAVPLLVAVQENVAEVPPAMSVAGGDPVSESCTPAAEETTGA